MITTTNKISDGLSALLDTLDYTYSHIQVLCYLCREIFHGMIGLVRIH